MSKTVKKAKTMPAKKKAVKKKAAPKKKAATLRPKTEASIIAELKKLGYKVRNTSYSESDFSFSVEHDNDDNLGAIITLNTEELPYCCGVKEVGGIEIESDLKGNNILDLLIAYAFIIIKEENIKALEKRKGITICRPILFCSNGVNACIDFERAARKYLKGHYKQVSETVNPTSHNNIKIFVSIP